MKLDSRLAGAAGALTLLLAGCGGLLGGGGTADLYRFGSLPSPAAEAAPPAGRPAMVVFAGSTFEPAIDGDRILTVTGSQAGYVAGARWIAPAPELFDSATVRAFEQRAPSARIVRIRGSPLPDYALGVDVRRFEVDYAGGAAAPPEVVIEARARLMRWSDRTLVDEWHVASREPATENRVAAIVQAFDRGTASVVTQVADRAQQSLARHAALTPGPGGSRQ